MVFEIQFAIAIILDLCLGDPRWFPHPVKMIGSFALLVEKTARRFFRHLLTAGSLSVVVIVGATTCLTWFICSFIQGLSIILAAVFSIFILYLSIAIKDLITHSKAVYKEVEAGELENAREAVSAMVGRDTSELSEDGVIKACVESVSENMVDGITAPIFWAIVATFFSVYTNLSVISLAAVGAMAYKSINTLDSMFGYRNERYILFGRAAAKLDDVANWPVARLSGLALVAASFVLGLDWKQSFAILKRDRLKHASPNGGHPEGAVAGALGIRLGGSSVYHGKKVYKSTIGDVKRRAQPRDILLTNKLVVIASLLFFVGLLMLRRLLFYIVS